jgi:drug/metabolite transporter (DMT)-like permease
MEGDARRGVYHAVVAAALFGGTAPGVEYFGRGAGPFATATLLYVGSFLAALVPEKDGEPIRRSDARRVLVVAALGAALAPAALAWGLQHAGATSGALVLNLEAVFTVMLARALYHERLGKRLMLALALIVAGGALLPLRTGKPDLRLGLGLLFVALSTLAWASDSTLSRPLAQRRPTSVIFWKSLVGIALSLSLALTLREPWPDARSIAGLIAIGVAGYGVSLRFYILAQRELGAARTGSVFGFSPLLGAAIAFALGDREGPLVVLGAAIAICIGVAVLATEKKPA